jgi:DNA-binding NarL/FixJ family response regulator
MDEQTLENRIRLVLVDDQALFRASLGRFLAAQPGLEVVGECGTDTETLGLLEGSSVDIVLLDMDRRGRPGAEFISAAQRAGYKGRFLVVAEGADPKEVAAAIKLGASGVFLKSEPPDRLVWAIRLVASGAIWIDEKIIQLLVDQSIDRPPADQNSGKILTEREERVLLGILGGLTNRKIGDHIGLSESSVKSVVQQLFVRAGVRTRSQLVRAALEGSLGAARESQSTNQVQCRS